MKTFSIILLWAILFLVNAFNQKLQTDAAKQGMDGKVIQRSTNGFSGLSCNGQESNTTTVGLSTGYDDDSGALFFELCEVIVNTGNGASYEDLRIQIVDKSGSYHGFSYDAEAYVDVSVTACTRFEIDPCDGTLEMSFTLDNPLKLSAGGRFKFEVAGYSDKSVSVDSRTYQVDLRKAAIKKWSLPPFFDPQEFIDHTFCTILGIPDALHSAEVELCMIFEDIEVIPKGFKVCPRVTASVGSNTIFDVNYRAAANTLATSCTGDECECIVLTYEPTCNYIVGELVGANGPSSAVNSYRSMDIDGSSCVSFEEFTRARAVLGSSKSSEQNTADFNDADSDSNGEISYTEYETYASNNIAAMESETIFSWKHMAIAMAIGVVFGVFMLSIVQFYLSHTTPQSRCSAIRSCFGFNLRSAGGGRDVNKLTARFDGPV